MRRLLLISRARSGTNLAQDLIGNAPNVLALREVFNPCGVFGLDAHGTCATSALQRLTGLPGLTERDPRAVAAARRAPLRLVATLEDMARELGRDGVSFTLFDGQLPRDDVARLVTARQTSVVLLARHALPRFISLRKTQVLGTWKHADTTATRPEVAAADLLRDMQAGRDWFAQVRALASAARRLRYEDDLAIDPAMAFERLRRAVPWLARPAYGRVPVVRMRRQDRETDVFARIANGPQLRCELDRLGVLDEALGYPDAAA